MASQKLNFSQYLDVGSALNALRENKLLAAGAAGALAAGLYGLCYLYRPRNMPPGPWGYPLVGSTFSYRTAEHRHFIELQKKYGDVFTLWRGGNSYDVIVSSYEAAKDALITQNNKFVHRDLDDGQLMFGTKIELFDGYFTDEYKAAKKRFITAFRTSGMNDGRWSRVFGEEFDKLAEELSREAGKPIDIDPLISKLTSRVKVHLLFGKSEMTGDTDNQNLVTAVSEWFDELGTTFPKKKLLPWFLKPFKRFFLKSNVTEKAWNLAKLYEKEIELHRAGYKPDKVRSICDVLLKNGDYEKYGSYYFASNFIIMGDALFSIAMALNWVVVYLIKYPQYQDELYQEIEQVVGKGRPVTLEDKAKLPLTRAFLEEVMRLTAAVTVTVGQFALEDTTLQGFNVPKHTQVRINMEAINQDPRRYPEPDKFKPERFVEGGEASFAERLSLLFSLGRRSCAGEQLVRSEMFFTLANLVQRFRLEVAPGETIADIDDAFFRSVTPYKLIAHQRK